MWKNPGDLTQNQTGMLAWIAKTDPRLHRAYLLKEGLRHVFAVKGEEGKDALERWLSWAWRCQIPAFIDLARKISKHRESIDAALDHNMSYPAEPPTDESEEPQLRPLGASLPPPGHEQTNGLRGRRGDHQPRRQQPFPDWAGRGSAATPEPDRPAGFSSGVLAFLRGTSAIVKPTLVARTTP